MTIKFHPIGLWIKEENEVYTIGLSEKGQDDIGEVMFVELPEFGKTIENGDVLFGVEGAKAVTEIVTPFAGQIKEVHKEIEDEPDRLNSEDAEDNWIVSLTDVDPSAFESLNDDVWAKA